MIAPSWALVWVAVAGAAGGALSAWLRKELRPLPSRVSRGSPALFRPGFVVNIVAGGIVAGGTFWVFAGAGVFVWVALGLLMGSFTARSISDAADKRILRAAVCKAAAAPAADPATIRLMELAPPSVVLKTAAALEPRRVVR